MRSFGTELEVGGAWSLREGQGVIREGKAGVMDGVRLLQQRMEVDGGRREVCSDLLLPSGNSVADGRRFRGEDVDLPAGLTSS